MKLLYSGRLQFGFGLIMSVNIVKGRIFKKGLLKPGCSEAEPGEENKITD